MSVPSAPSRHIPTHEALHAWCIPSTATVTYVSRKSQVDNSMKTALTMEKCNRLHTACRHHVTQYTVFLLEGNEIRQENRQRRWERQTADCERQSTAVCGPVDVSQLRRWRHLPPVPSIPCNNQPREVHHRQHWRLQLAPCTAAGTSKKWFWQSWYVYPMKGTKRHRLGLDSVSLLIWTNWTGLDV